MSERKFGSARMIPKSGNRFSDQIMRHLQANAPARLEPVRRKDHAPLENMIARD
jgi:hypothetical protein